MSLTKNLKWCDHLPEGWRPMFTQLVTAIAAADDGAVVEQAKQKFGGMRVYLNRLTQATEVLIDEASRQSARTCERCGASGFLTVTRDGYYETLCELHQGYATEPHQNPVVASFRYSDDGSLKKVDRS